MKTEQKQPPREDEVTLTEEEYRFLDFLIALAVKSCR